MAPRSGDWYAGRFTGPPYDEFILGADDVLRAFAQRSGGDRMPYVVGILGAPSCGPYSTSCASCRRTNSCIPGTVNANMPRSGG